MGTQNWRHDWQGIIRQLRVVNDCADEQRLIDTFSKPKAPTVLGFNLIAGSRD